MKMENFVKKFAEVEMQTRISVVEGWKAVFCVEDG
jgi:RNase P subunit RPR2